MPEFTPITTQEDFDKAMQEHLKKEREAVKKEYAGYLSPDDAKKRYEGYLSPEAVAEKYKGYLSPEDAEEKDKKIRGYETSSMKLRIAMEKKIPYELAERLSGESEDDIRKDADNIAKFLRTQNGAPSFSTEPAGGDDKRAAMRKMLSNLKED